MLYYIKDYNKVAELRKNKNALFYRNDDVLFLQPIFGEITRKVGFLQADLKDIPFLFQRDDGNTVIVFKYSSQIGDLNIQSQ